MCKELCEEHSTVLHVFAIEMQHILYPACHDPSRHQGRHAVQNRPVTTRSWKMRACSPQVNMHSSYQRKHRMPANG